LATKRLFQALFCVGVYLSASLRENGRARFFVFLDNQVIHTVLFVCIACGSAAVTGSGDAGGVVFVGYGNGSHVGEEV
jgi:hypothetical protein